MRTNPPGWNGLRCTRCMVNVIEIKASTQMAVIKQRVQEHERRHHHIRLSEHP